MIAKLTFLDSSLNSDLILSEITQQGMWRPWKRPNHLWINPHVVLCLCFKRRPLIPVCDVPSLRCQAFRLFDRHIFVNSTKGSKTWDNLDLGSNVQHREFWGPSCYIEYCTIRNRVIRGLYCVQEIISQLIVTPWNTFISISTFK